MLPEPAQLFIPPVCAATGACWHRDTQQMLSPPSPPALPASASSPEPHLSPACQNLASNSWEQRFIWKNNPDWGRLVETRPCPSAWAVLCQLPAGLPGARLGKVHRAWPAPEPPGQAECPLIPGAVTSSPCLLLGQVCAQQGRPISQNIPTWLCRNMHR